jgi:hypothetical protein
VASVSAETVAHQRDAEIITTLGLTAQYGGASLTYAIAKDSLLFVSLQSYSSDDPDVFILDIEKPSNPIVIGIVSGDFTRIDGMRQYNDYLFLNDRNGKTASVDISNPANPSILSTLSTDGSGNDLGGHEFAVQNGYLFGVSWVGDTVWSIDASDPTALTVADSIYRGGTKAGHSVTTRNGYLYLTSFDGDSNTHDSANLEIYDISDPTAMSSVSTVASVDEIHDLSLRRDHAFATTGGGQIVAFDISDPANPSETSILNLDFSRTWTHRQIGDRITLTGAKDDANTPTFSGPFEFLTVDISDPTNMVVDHRSRLSDTTTLDPDGHALGRNGRFVFSTHATGDLRVIDTYYSPTNTN